MRKFLVIFLCLAAGILFFNSILFSQGVNSAVIVFTQGDIKVKLANSTDWVDGKIDMDLKQGDSVKTGMGSLVEISLGSKKNHNIVKLEENTTAMLKTINAKLSIIELSQGKVFSLVSKLSRDAKFEIKTPTAAAGARGTGLSAEIKDKGAEFSAYEHAIYVQSFDQAGNLIKEITVEEGFKTFVDEFAEPSELIALSENERNSWGDTRNDLINRVEGTSNQGAANENQQINDTAELVNSQQEQREDHISDQEQRFLDLRQEVIHQGNGY